MQRLRCKISYKAILLNVFERKVITGKRLWNLEVASLIKHVRCAKKTTVDKTHDPYVQVVPLPLENLLPEAE